MGANFVSFNAPWKSQQEVRRDFEEAQRQDQWENGHCYSGGIGMARGLKFTASTFVTDKEADEWLMYHAQKWEEALVVKVEESGKPPFRIGAWCSS